MGVYSTTRLLSSTDIRLRSDAEEQRRDQSLTHGLPRTLALSFTYHITPTHILWPFLSTWSCIPTKSPSHPLTPSASMLLYRSTLSRVVSVDVLSKLTKTET